MFVQILTIFHQKPTEKGKVTDYQYSLNEWYLKSSYALLSNHTNYLNNDLIHLLTKCEYETDINISDHNIWLLKSFPLEIPDICLY